MHVLVIGATGGVGLLVIEYLLRESHTVVIYARTPSKLPENLSSNPSVTVIKGELTDREALKTALTGVHGVISALGPAVKKGPLHPSGTPLAKAYELILEVMRELAVRRLIILGTASMKDPNDKFSLEFWTLVNGVALFAHNAYKDVVAIGETVRSDPDAIWTIVRVPILTDKMDDHFIAGYVGDKHTKPWLPRRAFAAFVTEELSKNQWIRKQPLISSP
ncbi:NAD-P-binding protein [Hysterangium stoloniferum]|nr:NAD-P-binding protein [Hysterangium stoloniferum]